MLSDVGFAGVLLLCFAVAIAGTARAQEGPVLTQHGRLWDPESPGCILIHNPLGEPLSMPEPYDVPTFEDALGAGAREGQPLDLWPLTAAGPKQRAIQVAANNITITITYADGPTAGFNDPTLGPARRAAFEYATSIWAGIIEGGMDISVMAEFSPKGGTAVSAVLASASGPGYLGNGLFPGSINNIYYPAALTEYLAGFDPDPNAFDIAICFNSDVDGTVVLGNLTFYYGTDGKPGTNFDFVSTASHELAHGWGVGSQAESNGTFTGAPGLFPGSTLPHPS